ncbi:MAG: WD40 repeat domain-containing protein [Gemmataceae bacterium]
MSFPGFAAGPVAPTTYTLAVKPPLSAKLEPVSPKLVRTLVHPDRTAGVQSLRFTADGSRLFGAGYPSGVLQVWDVASGTEVRRIESPRGYRGSADYAELTADWATVFVPVEKRAVKQEEKNGEKVVRVEQSGEVRSWNLADGTPRPPLKLDRSPLYAVPSPDGSKLLTLERPSYTATRSGDRPADVIVFRDLAAGTAAEIGAGYGMFAFTPDGTRFVVAASPHGDKPARMTVHDATTGKVTATLPVVFQKGSAYWPAVSRDGRRVVAEVRSADPDRKSVVQVWDTVTGAATAELTPPKPDFVFYPRFSPDGRFVTGNGQGVAVVWPAAGGKPVLVAGYGDGVILRGAAVSPDGKTAAVAVMPQPDRSLGNEPDPDDLGQPWVDVYDLATGARRERLVCPPGWVTSAAFRPGSSTLERFAVGCSVVPGVPEVVPALVGGEGVE